MRKKIIVSIIVLGGISAISYGLSHLKSPAALTLGAQKKIQIVASFYPLADFANNIGGNLVEVTNMTPAGAEPHDYEPTPRDIAKIYNANLFLYNGNGIDVWGDRIRADLESKGVTIIKISDHLESLKNNAPDAAHNESYDPHFWLDPVIAQMQADVITNALIKIDPRHQQDYTENKDVFKKKLADLDQTYKNGLALCKLNEFVTSHNAFNYLAKRYHLSSLYILGLSPDQEPSAKTIAQVASEAKQKHIPYIFFETLVSPKLAQIIANEIGAQTLVLNPIEGLTDQEIAQGKNYLSTMRENLTNLQTALSCN